MKKKYFKTIKTARYFTLGNPGESIQTIWVVLHGYGQLAEYFLSKFSVLNDGRTLVVAPEACTGITWTGQRVQWGLRWMTREERETDIDDYVYFLDSLIDEIKSSCPNASVVVLGFSQGAATAARWVGYGKVKPVKVIFWGGLFPPDMNWDMSVEKWKSMNVHVVIGDQDEYYRSEEFREYYAPVLSKFGNARLHEYKGKAYYL